MNQWFHMVIISPAFAGVVAGLISAAAVDFHAFQTWKSFHDAAEYSWGLALWRWFQGAVVGAVTSSGLKGLVG